MAADPSKLSYFSLPGEVRNKIMDLVLVHGDVYPYTSVSETSISSRDTAANVKPQPGIQLIATCKQAYHEGHELFYSSNTFHLSPIMTLEWSDRLQAKHKAMIKRISITFGLDELTTSMISQINETPEKKGTGLGITVVKTLHNGWMSKMAHIAAWTSLEKIDLEAFNRRCTLQHHEAVDMLREFRPWPDGRHWYSVFRWPMLCVKKNIETKIGEVGRKKTIEWLYARKLGEMAEGFSPEGVYLRR